MFIMDDPYGNAPRGRQCVYARRGRPGEAPRAGNHGATREGATVERMNPGRANVPDCVPRRYRSRERRRAAPRRATRRHTTPQDAVGRQNERTREGSAPIARGGRGPYVPLPAYNM